VDVPSFTTPSQPDASQTTGPLDCANREAVLATVKATAVAAGALCDELAVTAGLGPVIAPEALHRFGRPLLEQLVEGALIDAALAARGRSVQPEEVRAELGRAGPAAASASGVERRVLERQVHARLARRRLVDLYGKLVVTEAEVAAEYAAHGDRWAAVRGPASVEGFVHRLAPLAAAGDIENGRAVAMGFAEALRAGRAEAKVSSRPAIRNLGTFAVSSSGIEPELEQAVRVLAVGTVSDPIRTRAGWVVVRVLSAGESRPRPLADAAKEIRAVLEESRRSEEEKRILAEIRAEARVVYDVSW